MDPILEIYYSHPDFWNAAMALLIFGGMARIAFWHNTEGMRVGAPLALGLGMLLTVAALVWIREKGHSVSDLGPWAAFILIEAILLLALNARRKSKQM